MHVLFVLTEHAFLGRGTTSVSVDVESAGYGEGEGAMQVIGTSINLNN